MGTSLNVLIFSTLTSLFFVVLFTVEQYRGRRYGENVRAVFDRMLSRIKSNMFGFAPEINNHFFQELFYYFIHKVLSVFLAIVRKIEHLVLHIVRFNRMKVIQLRTPHAVGDTDVSATPLQTDDHFAQIAEHKKSVELTPKEKQKRKDASISGMGPF